MKSCPTCSRLYPDDAGFCPIDGVELRFAHEVAPTPDADDPRVGQVLAGHYHVRRVVADGGMGRVYEALDSEKARGVALKVLHADVASDSVALERFKREFEISKYLPHEHIVEVFDFQQIQDNSYVLAMDYLEGEELRSVLKREKTLRHERVVRMLSQIAIGLDRAHQRHLIHRDLKPDNIFLCGTREGDIVKLLDFGSVKDKSEGAKKLTVMGTTIGSPFYMSPEQAQGLDTLDARADVWALAAITYEALSGEVPFKGNNGPSILLAILTKHPVPVSQAAASSQKAQSPIPPPLDDVLDQAFSKNVSMRIGSVGELADKVGHAYGLKGDHHQWAYTGVHILREQIEAALPALLAPRPPAASVEQDPFAEPDPFAAPKPAPLAPSADPAPVSVPASSTDLRFAGVPRRSPVLLVALILGGLLFLSAAVVIAALLLRR